MLSLKFSGRISPYDQLHQEMSDPDATPDKHYIPLTKIPVKITHPKEKTILVPQYAHTVHGKSEGQYDPAGDCRGYFMSSKFQQNNNCYAYGCNIASNTFPQPGRKSGYLITEDVLAEKNSGETVQKFAVDDGLEYVGKTMDDLNKFKLNKPNLAGHFVALMISPALNDEKDKWNSGRKKWPGDYHWARCNNSAQACNSWSQKDGGDQVTNFDFAGIPISNPMTANWTVNLGPTQDIDPKTWGIVETDPNDLVVKYEFYCFMFVPNSGVDII